MNSSSLSTLLMLTALAVPLPALAAAEQAAGPVQIGPAWGRGDPQHGTALLSTTITNQGGLADRLIRAECPANGQVALRNGTLHRHVEGPTIDKQQAAAAADRDPTADHPEQNGLDIPPSLDGTAQTVPAEFDLSRAQLPVTNGVVVPCSLYFAHAGQRVVVFTIGGPDTPTAEP